MLIHSTNEFSAWRKSVANQTVAFVPTMGALHSGHHSLIAHAAQQCDLVVVSIFVNALQFGDVNDYDNYPRDEQSDYLASITAGANVVFAPHQQELFPADFDRYLTPSSIANEYEGRQRPGHFAGVVTVVHRLFDIVQPDIAIFGAKDYQQVAVIRAMSDDLHPTIRIVLLETVRDTDGLALSSRNARLSVASRLQAQVIPRALQAIATLHAQGETRSHMLKSEGLKILGLVPSIHVEYLEIVQQDTLNTVAEARNAVVLFAGVLDGVRLIDNLLLQ
ncbi:MAG: pantoate--beta-alanine ligase [Ilumatobacteraceae bacterium]|nr:pantoate--beta-alanine ligase [Ilumatobacteraceae bacterium]